VENQIEIYKSSDNSAEIYVNLKKDTVWLSQKQMALLFDCSTDNISLHLKNIFKTEELAPISVTEEFSATANDGKNYKTKHYNLDAIISLGYRINSQRATQFRQWATQRLKDYLVKGYAINEQKLKASHEQFINLKQSIQLLQNVVSKKELTSDEAVGLLKVVSEYAQALDLLDQYDHQSLAIPETKKEKLQKITYKEAIEQITLWRNKQRAGKLFGNEKDKSFSSSL
jgi:hypothetical protein